MNESTIGTSALGHLAPLVDYLDADGPLLLSENVTSGILYKDYKLKVFNDPGLGIQNILLSHQN
jgi:hypothetical protein